MSQTGRKPMHAACYFAIAIAYLVVVAAYAVLFISEMGLRSGTLPVNQEGAPGPTKSEEAPRKATVSGGPKVAGVHSPKGEFGMMTRMVRRNGLGSRLRPRSGG